MKVGTRRVNMGDGMCRWGDYCDQESVDGSFCADHGARLAAIAALPNNLKRYRIFGVRDVLGGGDG